MSEGKLFAGTVAVAISVGFLAVAAIVQGDARQPFQNPVGLTWCSADKAMNNEA